MGSPFGVPFKEKIRKGKGVVELLRESIEKTEYKHFVFPEGTYTNGKSLLQFKTGAFANKNDVLPLVIRYVPSYKYDDVNWNSPKNTNISLLTHLKKLLVDGNIDVHIKFLDLQKYDEKNFKDGSEYAEDVREKMKRELKILPKQNSSALSSTKPTNEECIYFITCTALMITMVSVFFSDFHTAFHMISIAFSGFTKV